MNKRLHRLVIVMTAAMIVLTCGVITFGTTEGKIIKYDNYLYFGSYPQKEVVEEAGQSGAYNDIWGSQSAETNDVYIVDSTLYATLQSLSDDEWDSNGDTTVEGTKYRRIKESNAI